MRLAFVTTELSPWIKIGGLADVSASLPKALAALGHSVQILIPVTGPEGPPRSAGSIEGSGTLEGTSLTWQKTRIGNRLEVIWLGGAGFSDREGDPYADRSGREWADGVWRYGQLCESLARGWIPAENAWGPRPDLLHAHDWPGGLLPLWIRHLKIPLPTVFTIHNLAYTGLFSYEVFSRLRLPHDLWRARDGIEFYGSASCLKAGLWFADRLTTVSPSYADEILTPAFGNGLEGVLGERRNVLTGILNGIDTDTWDPATDPYLPAHYDSQDLLGKRHCHEVLCEELGLSPSSGPLAIFIGRLTPQKGIDLLTAIAPRLVAREWRLVLLGRGTPEAEAEIAALASRHPGSVRVLIEHSESWAHRLEAGADLFLMPSRFEPCGLNQQYSQRYGTIPIVHAVGGLRDTVQDADRTDVGTGFRFESDTLEDFEDACLRAERAWRDPARWSAIQDRAMRIDSSWAKRADAYVRIYEELLGASARPTS